MDCVSGAIFSQVTDPISGGAGWVGAGLLGLVLAWLLLKHLPEKDRQIKELVTDKDTSIKDLLRGKDEALDRRDQEAKKARDEKSALIREVMIENSSTLIKQQAEFRAALERVIQHCTEENKAINVSHTQSLNQLSELLNQLMQLVRDGRDLQKIYRKEQESAAQNIQNKAHPQPTQNPPPNPK